MIEDSIVEEIRKYRVKHAEHYNNDLNKICEALKIQEKKSKKEFIAFNPKPLQSKKYGS